MINLAAFGLAQMFYQQACAKYNTYLVTVYENEIIRLNEQIYEMESGGDVNKLGSF